MLDIKENSISDRYLIKEKLSQKAGRQTFLAFDPVTSKQVIVKILQFDNLFKWDDLKLFEREAKTLKNLNHPAIPKYLDYFEVDTDLIRGFALVQSYIDAPNLEKVIQQGRKFTETELIELAQKLLEILDYLHSYHPPIIHRDIKPSNILISGRTGNSIGELYLVDFGSVQTAASKEEGTITIVGSYGYIPLEQFGGQTTTASDLYSLGMTLIYVITGVHPAELPQHNGRVRFSNSQIGRGLQRWLLKITEPYLDKRFNSVKSAQAGLLAKEDNSEGFANLRPHNSKIRLKIYKNRLEIIFRKEKNQRKLSFASGFIFLIFLISSLIYSIILESTFLIWVWFIVFLVIILWLDEFLELKILNPYRTYHYQEIISISSDKSIQWNNYFNQKLKPPKWGDSPSPEEKVNLVVYHSGYTVNHCVESIDTIVPQKLSLYTDKKEYIIGDDRQSHKELWRIGREISNFLGLELQFMYPTPKIQSKNFKSTKSQKRKKSKNFSTTFNRHHYYKVIAANFKTLY